MMFIKKLGCVCLSTGILLSGVSSVLNIENNVYAEDNFDIVNVNKNLFLEKFENQSSILYLSDNIEAVYQDDGILLVDKFTNKSELLPIYQYIDGYSVKISYEINFNKVLINYKIIGQDRDGFWSCVGHSYLGYLNGFASGFGVGYEIAGVPGGVVGGVSLGIANEIGAYYEHC